ncbi:MAG: hypothetical protein CMF75_02295 [Maricaulis sp.]|nr:hypothetical protein [Maricaulis sp.]
MRALASLLAGISLTFTLSSGLTPDADAQDPDYGQPSQYSEPVDTYSQDELVDAVSDFFGVTAEAAASVLERVFSDLGRPVGYVAGEEVAAAAGIGLRYGEGYLTLKSGEREKVYWRGPSIGFDAGGNASRVFVLVYNLNDVDRLYQRFPGVEGSAYLVAGMGVNYQRADEITLAPIRSGVGLRAGANVGYLAYSRRRAWLPF